MKGHLFYNSLVSSPWAATLESVQHLHEVYWRIIDRKASNEPLDLEALAKELGRPLDNTRNVETRNRTAIIPVEGKIMPKADFFTEISGGVSVDVLARDFHTALNNPSIDSILLLMDSPGGQASGINEFANMVYDARGQKPIVAYVANEACSAAYWIASAADEIVIDAGASVGSIGVIGTVTDPSKANAREIKFVSSQSPRKRPDPNTTDGQTEIQSWVDALAEVFIEAVARNRGVSTETVTKEFGRGGLLVGRAAVKAGMADRIGSREQVISELASGTYDAKKKRRPMMTASHSTTGGASAAQTNQEHKAMSTEKKSIWARLFNRELSAEEKAELTAELQTGEQPKTPDHFPPHPKTPPPPPAPAAATSFEESDAYKRMQAQLETERNARIASEASAFADAEISARRALPAERQGIVALYTQAARDDAAVGGKVSFTRQVASADGKSTSPQPVEGTRVDALKAAYAARPAHALTREQVPFDASTMQTLDNGASDDIKQAQEGAKAYAESVNGRKSTK